ncbi:uncharacterized protein FA14DRAFT_161724 [Meira miltonrushii]|uniref:Arrestin-like N-terminal domain-containing protein n=1 Tax=Meira miltonrushii TaxID=1280837 RepID=A0A316VAJ7_9BASI|nr:uncharacterized protein FA14DRAFT_161724 [Meira miltonrushii]PWN34274.1 hypothetical protein FA14DRAFT_161724 [Meira miltonrushii]
MSRRDQLLQAVNDIQGQVYNYIDSRTTTQFGPGHPTSSTSQQQPSSSSSDSTASNLPLYSRKPDENADAIPQSVLNAPPGQAQAAADQMPRNRIARGTGREARAAAAALREEQLQSGQLKTKHTFLSSGARIILDINTAVPQKALTFMGGTADRGRGQMKGVVTIHAQPNERVSAIRIKIKAVVRVLVPRTGTPQQPFPLENTHPAVEQSVEKELLLLQLESQLYDANSASSVDSADPTMMHVGKHEFPFSIDLPSQTGKGEELPPSFVLSPLNKPEQVQRPPPKSKWETLTSSIPVPHLAKDWASIKWYAKVTVERPGIFRANERIFAPFVYLPPPPKNLSGLEEQLLRRLRLAGEVDSLLRRFESMQGSRPVDLQRLVEPLAQWESIKLAYGQTKASTIKQKVPQANKKADKPGFFSKMLFGTQVEKVAERSISVEKETFTLHVPKRPFVFALRSGIPYVLSRTVQYSGDGELRREMLSRVPTVGLFQKTNVFAKGTKGPCAGTTSRFLSPGRQPPDLHAVQVKDERSTGAIGKPSTRRKTEYWLGIIDLPPTCAPCFETPVLTLEYTMVVRHPQSPNPLHVEPIVLVCPPSRPVRIAPSATSSIRAPSRTTTPVNAASYSRRQSSGPAVTANAATPPSKIISQTNQNVARPVAPAPSKANQNRISSNPTAPISHSPRPSQPGTPSGHAPQSALASRPVPSTPPVVPPVQQAASRPPTSTTTTQDEKRVMQSRLEEEARMQRHQQIGSSSSSAAGSSATSQPASVATSSQAPPPSSSSSAASTAMQSTTQQAAGTPLTVDESDTGHSADQWQFQDDELTDLPPSYFEATGMPDED